MSATSRDEFDATTAPDLVSWLRSRPDVELARLLRRRPDLAHPVPSDVRLLGIRATGRVSVDLALDRLDLGSIVLLEALALLPEPTSRGELTDLLGVDDDELVSALAGLREVALVWGDDDELHLLDAVRELLPFPAGLGPPARTAWAVVPAARLPRMLADLSALLTEAPTAVPNDPADALAQLLAVFEDPQRLAAALAAVPPVPREVIDLLAAGPPVGRTTGALRPVDAASADSPLRWLLAHGLLVAVDDYTVVLPREIGVLLRGGRPLPDVVLSLPPLPTTAHPTTDVDATAAGQVLVVLRLVESLLEAWGIEPPGVLRAGGVGVRELRRAARSLDVDERVAALVVEVAHAAGLLAADEQGERWLPTAGSAGYDGWLAKPPAQRWCQLATAWLATTRVPALVGRRSAPDGGEPRSGPAPNALGPDVDRTLAPAVRVDVMRLLSRAEPGTAPDGAELDDAVVWCAPRRAGTLRRELATWCREEAELLGLTGRGALSSFSRLLVAGLVESDDEIRATADETSDTDGVDAAAEALAALLPQPLDHVLIQADLTAVAPGPLEPELRRELALLADVESTGGATVYRFSPSSIRRALDAGRTAADIHALLAAKSRTPIPQPLTYLIDDTARRHGRIRVGSTGSYVRCDDEAVLREVLANRRLDDLLLRQLAPTVLVSPLAAELVVQRLRDATYAPAAESTAGAVLSGGPQPRRAPARSRTPRRLLPGVPSPAVAAAAVRAIRAGDRAVTASRPVRSIDNLGVPPPRSTLGDTVAVLREAAATGALLSIGYLNAQGQASNRVVEPLRVAGGYLTAFDHRHEEVRTFAVHRITGVAWLDADLNADDDATG
jgi:hypothetical protein